jgi:hypothetical protein
MPAVSFNDPAMNLRLLTNFRLSFSWIFLPGFFRMILNHRNDWLLLE